MARFMRCVYYTFFPRGDRRGDRSCKQTCNCNWTCNRTCDSGFAQDHGLNTFNFMRSNVRLSQRLCKLQPITSTTAHQCDTRLAMAFVWSVEESVMACLHDAIVAAIGRAIDRATGCMYVYTVRSSRRSVARSVARPIARSVARPIAATIAPCKHTRDRCGYRSARSVARSVARLIARPIAATIAATIAPCKHAITEPRLGLNPEPRLPRMSRSTAHGIQVI